MVYWGKLSRSYWHSSSLFVIHYPFTTHSQLLTKVATVTVTTSTASMYGYEILVGIGAGCYAQAGYAVIQAIVEPSMMAYGIVFMMLV